MANHAVTAVDIAKNIFEVAVSIQPGRVKERKRLPRKNFLRVLRHQAPGPPW